ncbi:MAG: hypothetical protein ACJ76H_08330 [Bacteriovoracaceae bacterium]
MNDGILFKNIRYYASYQLIYVSLVVILSSIGAFFHFLLNHEISIVESWLHNNSWEILITSKLISLFLLNRWFSMRLYQLKSIRELIRELVSWPRAEAVVVPVFMTLGYLSIAKVDMVPQNIGYWYYHFASFIGLCLFFGVEFIVIAYLDDVLNQKEKPNRLILGLAFTAIFAAAYRMSVPDYYGLLPFVVLSFSSLLYLSGKSFKSWSNVVCFLLLFVAPMGAVFGLDPVWGNDFSPARVETKLNVAFLAAIWVISFSYYKYRLRFLDYGRRIFTLR